MFKKAHRIKVFKACFISFILYQKRLYQTTNQEVAGSNPAGRTSKIR